IDDDCDGQIDEGCACTSFATSLPTSQLASGPQLVWTGTGYLVLADDATDMTLLPVGSDGSLGSPAAMYSKSATLGGGYESGSFAWTGDELGVVWIDATKHVMTRRFDRAAMALGPAGAVSTITSNDFPRVLWTGDRFVVFWTDSTTQIVSREV